MELLQKYFSLAYNQVVDQERVIYGDYLIPGAEPKVQRAKWQQWVSPVQWHRH